MNLSFAIFLIMKAFLLDLMVPAAKNAHPPKYKLFGGTCYAYVVSTKNQKKVLIIFFSTSSLPPWFLCVRWSLYLGRSPS